MEYENIASLFTEKPIAFRKEFAIALGGIDESLYLQQLLYWSNKGARDDGWFYKKMEEIEDETTLKRKPQDRCKNKLESMGLIETKVMVVKNTNKPITHFKINFTNVQKVLLQYTQTDSCKRPKGAFATVQTGQNTITENTTENTTEREIKKNLEKQVGEVIKEMENIDPKNKTYYQRKIQRQACKFLIENYTFEKTIEMIKIIPMIKNKIAYFPSITSPLDLQEKWVKVLDAVERYKIQNKSKREVLL